jgi:hypothetical protein
MPSAPDKPLPRCLLCGMHCPVGVQHDRLGHLRTVFPSDLGADHGACVLGVTAGRLIAADERVFRARVDGQSVGLGRALDALAERLGSADPARTALVVDLNRPLEGLAWVHALAAEALPEATVSAFVPPQDAAVAEAGVGSMPPLAELARRDLVVTVGDVCSSHPAITHLLRNMQRAERGNRWVAIDVMPSRTTRAADEQVIVRPEALAAFLCAVAATAGAEDLTAALGESDPEAVDWHADLMHDRVRDLAARARRAGKAGFVVSPGLGRCSHASSAIAAVQALAEGCDGEAWVLPLCMNTFVLPALAKALALKPLGELQTAIEAGDVDTLMVIGFDPSAVLPEHIWRAWSGRPQTVLWAGSLICGFSEVAGIAVPLALAWEESGSMVCHSGDLGHFEPWTRPPGGVPTTQDLVEAVAERMGRPGIAPPGVADIAADSPAAPPLGDVVGPGVLDVLAPEEGQVTIVGALDTQGYTGGLHLGQCEWQVRVAPEEAACSGRAADGVITLGDAPGLALPCRRPPRLPHEEERADPVVAVPAHWPAARELFEWQASPSGVFRAEPHRTRIAADE